VGIFRPVICLRAPSGRPKGGCQRGRWTLSLRNISNVLRKSISNLSTFFFTSSSRFGVNEIRGTEVAAVAKKWGWCQRCTRPSGALNRLTSPEPSLCGHYVNDGAPNSVQHGVGEGQAENTTCRYVNGIGLRFAAGQTVCVLFIPVNEILGNT